MLQYEEFRISINNFHANNTLCIYIFIALLPTHFFFKADRRRASTRSVLGYTRGCVLDDLDPSSLGAANYYENLPTQTSYEFRPFRENASIVGELNFNFSPGIPVDSTAISVSRYRERARPPTGRSSLFRLDAREDRPDLSPSLARRVTLLSRRHRFITPLVFSPKSILSQKTSIPPVPGGVDLIK